MSRSFIVIRLPLYHRSTSSQQHPSLRRALLPGRTRVLTCKFPNFFTMFPNFLSLTLREPLAFAPIRPIPTMAAAPHPRRARTRTAKRTRNAHSRTHTRTRTRTTLPNDDKWSRVQPQANPPPSSASDLRPESCPALVLNADFSPLSYMPLSLWPWQEVIKAVFLDRVTVVATYNIGVRSPRAIFPLPSVISLKEYQPVVVKRPAFSRFNVFMRDKFTCQYCGEQFPTHELTFDHVIPRCCNGKTNWNNVVTACVGCNHRKGRKMLHQLKNMKLKRMPHEPSNAELQANAKKYPPQYLHESWRDYIYWSQTMKQEEDQEDK